jgi:hypothetical protein
MTPSWYGLSPPEEAGFNFAGEGGLLVNGHYERLREILERLQTDAKFREIAPAVGSEEYYDWLKRMGIPATFTMRAAQRP